MLEKQFRRNLPCRPAIRLLVKKVSDSDLPSKAFEPRAGEAVVTNEHRSWCGYAEGEVSRLKRCGGCFQLCSCV